MAESIAEFFRTNFGNHRAETAYRQRRGYRMESYTYGEILSLARGFARFLEEHGIAKGDRVMIWGENCAEWVAVFFGCALRGVVLVPMDDAAASDFAVRVLRQVGAKLVMASQKHLWGQSSSDFAVSSLSFEDLAAAEAEPSTADVVAGREDVLQIVFTSGTT